MNQLRKQALHTGLPVSYADEVSEDQVRKIDELVREEFQGEAPIEFRIVEVLHIEDDPGPDMAFLRIDWTSNPGAAKRDPRVGPARPSSA